MAVRDSISRPTVHSVFSDYTGRRAALIRALVTDVDTLISRCHPEGENLCLYGLPDGRWEVKVPPEERPSDNPEPTVGINFARDGMPETEWLYLVAVHSDCWLLATALYNAARHGFDKDQRERLFDMINNLPPISEIVTEEAKKKQLESASNDLPTISEVVIDETEKEQSKSASHNLPTTSEVVTEVAAKKLSKSPSNDRPTISEVVREEAAKLDEECRDEHANILCAECGESRTYDVFWICCNICKLWFHGHCVMVSPAMTAIMQHPYMCKLCIRPRARA